MYAEVKQGISCLKSAAKFGSRFRTVADPALQRIVRELSAPRTEPVTLPTIANMDPLCAVVQDKSKPMAARIAALKTIGSESIATLTCILAAKISVDDQELVDAREQWLRYLNSAVR